MKKEKPVASPKLTEELLQNKDLVQEYVEYLRLKVKKDDDGPYYCGSARDNNGKCWDKTERFCKKKGLDFQTVWEKFMIFGCESNVANDFDLNVYCKENMRIGETEE